MGNISSNSKHSYDIQISITLKSTEENKTMRKIGNEQKESLYFLLGWVLPDGVTEKNKIKVN